VNIIGGIGSGRKPEGKNKKLCNAKLPKSNKKGWQPPKGTSKESLKKAGYIKRNGSWELNLT
jgi:hypothetical protein